MRGGVHAVKKIMLEQKQSCRSEKRKESQKKGAILFFPYLFIL